MDKQDELAALGYQVIDASNPVVKVAWIVRCPGMEDRVLIAATEAEGWSLAADHASCVGGQRQLAAILRKVGQDSSGHCPASEIDWDAIAAAVRSFIGSDEMVEAAAKAHCDYFGGEGWWETGLLQDTLPEARRAMQAALSAAIGEDIGGGRG